MLNAYYDFRNDSAFTPWVSAGGLATPEFTRKQPVSVPGITGTGSSGRESLSRSGPADNFA